jgi:hypothetical protein
MYYSSMDLSKVLLSADLIWPVSVPLTVLWLSLCEAQSRAVVNRKKTVGVSHKGEIFLVHKNIFRMV